MDLSNNSCFSDTVFVTLFRTAVATAVSVSRAHKLLRTGGGPHLLKIIVLTVTDGLFGLYGSERVDELFISTPPTPSPFFFSVSVLLYTHRNSYPPPPPFFFSVSVLLYTHRNSYPPPLFPPVSVLLYTHRNSYPPPPFPPPFQCCFTPTETPTPPPLFSPRFSVALHPQKLSGLLGTGSQRLPPRRSK